MTTELELRLKEFVDRDSEMGRFVRMLESAEKPIMFISGGGGLGKSSLLAKMIHECAVRGLRKSEVTWTETQNHDYLGIMRKMRDDIGPEFFSSFTTLINQFTDPSVRIVLAAETGKISVAEGLKAENASIQDIGGVIVKDNFFVVPKGDTSVPESERMIPLTKAFIDNLATAAKQAGPIIVFFDAVEKMTRETSSWVTGELLKAVQTGTLERIFFVHCGREKPQVDRFLDMIAEDIELGPLGQSDIVLYLEKRGVEADGREKLGALLYVMTKGNLLQVTTLVDAYIKQQKK